MVATARDDSKVFDDAFNTISTLQGISEAVQLQWTSTRPVTRPSRSSMVGPQLTTPSERLLFSGQPVE